jgi:hypothetical protein
MSHSVWTGVEKRRTVYRLVGERSVRVCPDCIEQPLEALEEAARGILQRSFARRFERDGEDWTVADSYEISSRPDWDRRVSKFAVARGSAGGST